MLNQYGQTDYSTLANRMLQNQQQGQNQQQQLPQIPSGLIDRLMGGGEAPAAEGSAGGFGSGGMSGWAGAATPFLYAYLIGQGKMIESRNPDSAYGKALLGGLGPSFNQLKEDPIGMGLPTLLGAPFLTPFTGSKKARHKKPEFAGIWDGIGLP